MMWTAPPKGHIVSVICPTRSWTKLTVKVKFYVFKQTRMRHKYPGSEWFSGFFAKTYFNFDHCRSCILEVLIGNLHTMQSDTNTQTSSFCTKNIRLVNFGQLFEYEVRIDEIVDKISQLCHTDLVQSSFQKIGMRPCSSSAQQHFVYQCSIYLVFCAHHRDHQFSDKLGSIR